ncbi:type II secretion system F family protein [Lapillicoccus jejuensis]|uniref:Type II secretion system (T2SS) protein F n=1 Tax=Lapillicoccus jejuensis TaxID=402171 RepID=A0A542DXR1_9MICO|nr:type II secretion system F family protein [Lapillicoccus jejuensis]TQJ07877.1 type II secretion system (T2SS) protein F [Lapillicoccus jejuensis]
MVLLAVALRSGCGVTEAVEAVAAVHDDDPGPVAVQLRAVAAALRWGVAPYPAWTAADPAWARVATVLAVAARAGTAPGPPLLRAARDLRAAEAAAVEVAAARAGVRLVAPLGLVFLPAFVLTTLVPVVLALAGRVLG